MIPQSTMHTHTHTHTYTHTHTRKAHCLSIWRLTSLVGFIAQLKKFILNKKIEQSLMCWVEMGLFLGKKQLQPSLSELFGVSFSIYALTPQALHHHYLPIQRWVVSTCFIFLLLFFHDLSVILYTSHDFVMQ